jgi:hypothetical protein
MAKEAFSFRITSPIENKKNDFGGRAESHFHVGEVEVVVGVWAMRIFIIPP